MSVQRLDSNARVLRPDECEIPRAVSENTFWLPNALMIGVLFILMTPVLAPPWSEC